MTGDVAEFGRLPPHDIAAEQVTLGSMMMSPAAIGDVSAIVTAGDHYRPAHQVIHEVIMALHGAGSPTDVVAVAAELAVRGDLGRAGGLPYLHTLFASVPTAANGGYYARIVLDRAVKRRIIELGTRITQLGWSAGEAGDLAGRAQAVADSLTDRAVTVPAGISELVTGALASLEQRAERGLPLPWPDVQALLGITPGSFTVVAARPGIGKSVLGLGIAAHVAIRHGAPALVFALEMSAQEMTLRLLSAEGRVAMGRLTRRELEEADWDRLARAAPRVTAAPLMIRDEASATLAYVRAEVSAAVRRQQPPAVVIIDYLQLMTPPRRSENRQQEVAALSRGCKLIARHYGIPVIAMAQLNRGPEQRAGKRPEMSDLRESGAIEADADNVVLLHRPDMADPDERPGEIDLVIAKQRMGPTGWVTLCWQGAYQRLVSLAPGGYPGLGG